MENPEEVLQSLDEFAKLKPKDIPRELEEYLSYVAKTGDPVYQWSIVKCLFREKLLNVITDFYETSPTIDLPPCPNVDPFNYETMKNSLIERLESFPSAPFTVQRLCELLTTPRKEYSRADKFMRAIEKNILVVSTREPGNVRRSDSNGQSELLMNGVMDGRGIELGEAIETVSSDGVNMMHANENEVNVTENENVVTVECGGMEEIDMEEQSENMEATTTTSWDKEQSDSSCQKEEKGNTEKIVEKEAGDDKSKDNPDSVEDSNADNIEDSNTDNIEDSNADNIEDSNADSIEDRANPEHPISVENAESHEVVPETPDSETGPEESKQESDITETNNQPDTSVPDEKPPKQSEELLENSSPDADVTVEKSPSEEKTTSEEETVDSTSAAEDLSNSNTSTETTTVVQNSNDETAHKNESIETPSLVVPNASESIAEVTESESGSSSSDATPAETSTKDDEKSIVVDSVEVTDTTTDVSTSNAESVEEVTSTKSSTEEDDISETKQEISEQALTQEVACQQEEAMEVDEPVSSELPSTDVEEPMDQSEQPTTEQLES